MTIMRIRYVGTIVTVGCWVAVAVQATLLWSWRCEIAALELTVGRRPATDAATKTSGESNGTTLATLEAHEAELRDELWPVSPDRTVRPVPSDRSASFLDLLHFRQAMETLAVSEGIVVGEAGFGFRDYAHSGPEPEDRAFIHRQREAAGRLLRLLFSAKPREWLGLRRDAPPSMKADLARLRPEISLDLFEPPAPLIVDGLADRVCFEIRFSADTGVLRRFLNALAAEVDCVVVRQVEASPATLAQPVDGAIEVVQRETEFRVVVEWIEPVA